MSGYRAEVVGSLLRPDSVRRARAEYADGRISRDRLAAVEDDAVRHLVDLQRSCGLPVVTDGEVRRGTYVAPLTDGLEGLAETADRYKVWRDAGGNTRRVRRPHAVVGRIGLRESTAVGEYRFARTVSDLPVKVTLPSPMILLSRWSPELSAAAYPDPYELFADTAAILRRTVAELVERGCRYIQFDMPDLTTVVDPESREEPARAGISESAFLETGCDLVNRLADVGRGDVRFAIHLCRGNNQGMFLRSGGYERLITTLYDRTPNVSTLMLEFDDDRSGDFAPLEGVPAGKILVLGLVSTKTAHLEDRDTLLTRIDEAARYVPLDQLALSTQCGFSPTTAGAPLTEADERAKLALVTDVAAEVWP